MADIIDMKDFMERVQDDKELLVELLQIYQDDFVIKRQALDDGIKTKDANKVREVAHSLKGASGNISAKEMHANFLKIEQLGKSGDLGPVPPILTEIDKQFVELKAFAAKVQQEFSA
jgi:HPt (histidine-containing phosphotransfer) domain-containing protein